MNNHRDNIHNNHKSHWPCNENMNAFGNWKAHNSQPPPAALPQPQDSGNNFASESPPTIKTFFGFGKFEPNPPPAALPQPQDSGNNFASESPPTIKTFFGFGKFEPNPPPDSGNISDSKYRDENELNKAYSKYSLSERQEIISLYNKNNPPEMPETYGENKSRDAMRFYTIEEKWKMLEDYERSKEKESNPPPANSPGQTGKEEPIPESNRDNQSETTSIVPCDNTVRQQSNDIVPYMGRQIVPYTNTQTDIFRNYPTILNPEDIFSPTPSNDTGNADFLMRLFGDKLIYVEKYGFLYWNGKIWKMCSDKKLKKYVIEEMKCRDIYYKENSDYDVDDAFSKQSGNNNRIDAAIELLKAKLYIDSELLDSAKHILCVRNGVIDFETQTLNPHSMYKDCYLTKMADVDYYDYHIDNTWQSFINSITSGDREKAAYLQKAFGAAVIGNPKEQKVHILLGNGSNGKSTLLNAIRNTLTSEYVCEMPITVITGSDNPDANAANPAIAALEGKLIAIASEVGSGAVLNEAKLKKLCGGGTISARKLRQNTHEFEPTFSIFIDTNCLPKVKNASSAEAFSVFRRFAIIPFNNTFDANRDTSLGDRLKTESTKTAILTWLIQGAFEYMNNPCLTPTQEMKDALGRYKMTENTVGGFIGDCIDITDNPNDFISSADLYNRYCEYCEEKGASPVNKDTFSKYGDLKNYKGRNSKSRGYKGIRLLDK